MFISIAIGAIYHSAKFVVVTRSSRTLKLNQNRLLVLHATNLSTQEGRMTLVHRGQIWQILQLQQPQIYKLLLLVVGLDYFFFIKLIVGSAIH